MTLVKGDASNLIREYQANLNKYFNAKVLQEDGIFGAATETFTKKFQSQTGLVPDGIAGPLTLRALSEENSMISTPVEPTTPVEAKPSFGAPWVFEDLDILGLYEDNLMVANRYVPEWVREGLNYKDLIGKAHAWCMLAINSVLRRLGIKGTGSAGASSLSGWGKLCQFWFGCFLPIEHANGGRHAAIFLFWIDEARRIAATLDRNKGNRFDVNITDLSGHGAADHLVHGPRWPLDFPDGQFVSMEEVLAKYPFFKPKGRNQGTT